MFRLWALNCALALVQVDHGSQAQLAVPAKSQELKAGRHQLILLNLSSSSSFNGVWLDITWFWFVSDHWSDWLKLKLIKLLDVYLTQFIKKKKKMQQKSQYNNFLQIWRRCIKKQKIKPFQQSTYKYVISIWTLSSVSFVTHSFTKVQTCLYMSWPDPCRSWIDIYTLPAAPPSCVFQPMRSSGPP